jgi:predicted nucleic acid-binding protein
MFTALFDACVLYPAPLRDVLLEVGVEGIFRPRWSDQIHDEWMRNLLRNRPDLSRESLQRTRRLMDQAVPDCLVTGHEALIDTLTLPDKDDRHVLAAAIVAQAGVIVTYNLTDFPEAALAPYGIEAQHPDDFLIYQFEIARGPMCGAIKRLRARLKNPPLDVQTYLNVLLAQGLPQFVQTLEKFEDLL